MTLPAKQTPPEVQIVHQAYQPSKAELDADLRIKGTFKQAIQALLRADSAVAAKTAFTYTA